MVHLPLLTTKIFIPTPRSDLVLRLRLLEVLKDNLQHKLTLISAPAGFGKTTLLSNWAHDCERLEASVQVAWLSLDERDNDLTRFLIYLVAALQTVVEDVGEGVLMMLQSQQPIPIDSLLTPLVNEIMTTTDDIVLILDDYHLIDNKAVDDALIFLLENLPPQMRLIMATREDPQIPLTRLRARNQLTELRVADLRFNITEATEFLNQVMGLDLTAENIAALENRTEGWITGLHLAALSMRGSNDTASFIQSFTGSHRYVLDYLIEEVLEQQSEEVQMFLLHTSILDRLNGSLCDAVTDQDGGQQTLEYLERANLFIIPLDNERQWYRYHHLFSDLLRLRLHQHFASTGNGNTSISTLHMRASKWYEKHNLEIDAFHHAAIVNDVENALRLIEGNGLPLHFRGIVYPVLTWLESLPASILNTNPLLLVTYAMALLTIGQIQKVEEILDLAETAITGSTQRGNKLDDRQRDIIGRIANARGNLVVSQYDAELLFKHSRRALEYLHPENLTYRTAATWKLGVAYEFQGDLDAANQAYSKAIEMSQVSGNIYSHILSVVGLGNIQLARNQLDQAVKTYRHVLQMVGDLPIPVGPHVHLCLARIFYEWNDLDAAWDHGQQCNQQAQPFADFHDIHVASQIFLARVKLAHGNVADSKTLLAAAQQSISQHNFVNQVPVLVDLQVLTLLHQGKFKAAANLVEKNDVPISRVRVLLALGDSQTALQVLNLQLENTDRVDERIRLSALQAVAYHINGETRRALHLLNDVFNLTEQEKFVRLFVDEGLPMKDFLSEAVAQGTALEYTVRLLAAFSQPEVADLATSRIESLNADLIEPLSERELEVLNLIAEGLTNQKVADRLYLSLHTVKTHTRNIYGKLAAHNRTEAVNKARALGILTGS